MDVVEEIKRRTGGVDVAIEAPARSRHSRPRARLASVARCRLRRLLGKLQIPYETFGAGLADYTIVTTLCPGGKERMRRLLEMVRYGKLDLRPLLTHRFKLDQIKEAYNVFGNRMGGVMKVAITP
jgi:threonine dehydrogenase-like Zn-dependent dehydrogenase